MSTNQPQFILVDPKNVAQAGKDTLAATEAHTLGMVLVIVLAVVLVFGIFGLACLVRQWRRPVVPPPPLRTPKDRPTSPLTFSRCGDLDDGVTARRPFIAFLQSALDRPASDISNEKTVEATGTQSRT